MEPGALIRMKKAGRSAAECNVCDHRRDGIFHRLAVAYGLAHDPLNLGDYLPPDDAAPSAPPPTSDYRDNFVGQEQT